MKILSLIFTLLFVLTGCVMNTKNLSFDNEEDKKFRVTFDCTIPFDNIRKVASYEEKNTTKDSYFVEFANIYESQFDVTKTYLEDSDFSNENYLHFLEEEGSRVFYGEEITGILYLKFEKRGKILNQIVSATKYNINIINTEPMMFDAIKNYCSKK